MEDEKQKRAAEEAAEVKRMSEQNMPPFVTRLSMKLRGANYARKDRTSKDVTLDEIDRKVRGE